MTQTYAGALGFTLPAIEELRAEGLSTIALPYEQKYPPREGWERFCRKQPTDAELRSMFDDGARHNIAVACGPASAGIDIIGEPMSDGLVVVIFNDRGLYEALTRGDVPSRNTWVAESKRGPHIYLRISGELPSTAYWTRGDSKARVLELRSTGAYVVAPPSKHPDGPQYVWREPRPEHILALSDDEFDDWLEIRLAHAAERGWALRRTIEAGRAEPVEGQIIEGSRDTVLASLAGSMRRRGMTKTEIAGALHVVNQERCVPPLPDRDVDRIATSVARYESQDVPSNGISNEADVSAWPEPENRAHAVLSDLGRVQYVEDLIRPGHIIVWAAEEGAGKSFAVAGELGIRLAAAGGSFAGTWPIQQQGSVLVLSEMHADDDFEREKTILESLELSRGNLDGHYWRLPLMTAAGGQPCLRVADWRQWCIQWCRDHNVVVMIVDTATGATDVNPWGSEIQSVYRDLRGMLDAYPDLAIILVVHCRKPQGHGERKLHDVLGEWGRWCDVVVLQEREDVQHTKISTFKRVRQQRRIVATQHDGLLVDAKDITDPTAPKVPLEKVVLAIKTRPAMTIAELATDLKVSKATAGRYVKTATDLGHIRQEVGARGAAVLFCVWNDDSTASPHRTASQSDDAVGDAPEAAPPHHASPTYIGDAVGDAVHSNDVLLFDVPFRKDHHD